MAGLGRPQRIVTVIALATAVAPGAALADAPTPVAATTGTVVVAPDGTRTLTVQGHWVFSSQTTNCNLALHAAGVAVDWGDPTQPGNAVGVVDGRIVAVGTAAANGRNAADNRVHPTPATTFPLASFGGCGLFVGPPRNNAGVWGPLTHTYASGSAGSRACAVMYDVHLVSNGGPPKAALETVAGGNVQHNPDNTVASSHVLPAAGCTTVAGLNVAASGDAVIGGAISASASLGGASAGAAGTIDLRVYGPDDPGCSGAPAFTSSRSVNGNGSYVSAAFTPAAVGTYRWTAQYSGDATDAAIDIACNGAGTSVTVFPRAVRLNASVTSATSPFGAPFGDTAVLTATAPSAPSGTITFSLFGPSDMTCAGPPVWTSTRSVTGNGTYNAASYLPMQSGTYRWTVSYGGDAVDAPASTSCNDAGESVTVGPQDTTKPLCVLSATLPGPPKQLEIVVQDPQSGLAMIAVDSISNATASWPSPIGGTTAPVTITATKVNQRERAFLRLTVTNGAGLATVCDPVVPAGHAPRRPAARALPESQRSKLALRADAGTVDYGARAGVTLYGSVPGAGAAQAVTILSRSCLVRGTTELATIRTGKDGRFRLRLQPGLGATFAVSWNGLESRTVRVGVRPLVALVRLGPGRYRAAVSTTNGVFLTGTHVVLQRRAGGGWLPVARGALAPASSADAMTAVSSASFAAHASGAELRAVVPATACYSGGTSVPIRG